MSFLKGKIHGFFLVYDKKGEVLSKDRYHMGEQLNFERGNKNSIICHCDSLKKEKLTFGNKEISKFKGLPFTGICYDYYPETEKKYMEINYKDGFVDGDLIIYDKSGKPVTREVYEDGNKIK